MTLLLLLIKIILGLIGLGIVVFVHELGHFLAARLVKIDVEAFSIGWGKPFLKKKIGTVEYRLGVFPVGGYCKMKGEGDYIEAWEEREKGIMPEKGSYLAAHPAARILVCFAGPFFNLLLAVILLSSLWGVGFRIQTLGNKIVLASELTPGEVFPADTAGFKTGDRILEIEGNKISYFHEIQENIAVNPNKPLPITVERDGKIIQLQVTPSLEKSSGAGRIGVAYWADIVIESVKDGSPCAEAGLLPGDIVTAANGQPLYNISDLIKALDQEPGTIVLKYERNGTEGQAAINSKNIEEEIDFSLALINYHTPKLSFPAAVVKGVKESFKTLALSIKSLRLLFMGIDLTQAVSGPVRITYMMGDMAAKGGLRSFVELIALISVALCMMNLLPLPVIDGGMIILFLVELIRGKPANPRAISIFQTCGVVIISCLMFFAIFGDIMFFVRR